MTYVDFFEELGDVPDIARSLGCTTESLEYILEKPHLHYQMRKIPKRRHPRARIVYEVKSELKSIHKNILSAILDKKISFPSCVQGFIVKRSIFTNASLHLGKKRVLNLDIEDFFDSIKIEKVLDIFKSLGCSHEAASILASVCTFNGKLVQGSNTSPILANLACKKLDEDLCQIARDSDCVYSRYVDDITFSGLETPGPKVISKCVETHGFKLNDNKQRYQKRGRSQYVTGLTVFDEQMPRLPKQMKRKLRQELYYIEKHGLQDHLCHLQRVKNKEISPEEMIGKIDGLIAFMYSIEPRHAYTLDVLWQQIRLKEKYGQSRHPSEIAKRKSVSITL